MARPARSAKKLTFRVWAIVGLIGAAILFITTVRFSPPVPEPEDVWIPDNVVLRDSAQIPGSPRAYAFQYDAGAFGYTVRMVSFEKPSHEAAVLQSDQIVGIRWATADSLIVDLTAPDYVVVGNYPNVTIVPRVASGPAQ